MTIRRRPSRSRTALLLTGALLLGGVVLPTVDAGVAQAVSAESFNAGNIISDGEFYNGAALTPSEVQSFLSEKNPNCAIGTPPYLPGAISPSGSGNIIASNCLKNFRMNTSSRVADSYCGAYAGAPNESAAQIIAKVGKACGISQKVLLVMLEKEQSLITDSWPVTRQYNYAMGMNCPDSGPNGSANCNSDSAGFYLQMILGARQLKVYRAHPDSFNYKPFQNNTIAWHPNPSLGCGTSQVYIQNWATAALYIYTPYRPNQAALNAGWGTGDACSSYGNRNFYLFYNNWFIGSKPIGYVDGFSVKNDMLSLAGWALDPDSLDPINVHVYVGQKLAAALRADQSRPDVAAAFPGHSAEKGYYWQSPLDSYAGKQDVCIFAINHPAGGENPKLGCTSVQFTGFPEEGRTPIGNIDGVSVSDGALNVRGWTIDPDTASPISTHVYIGSTLVRAAKAEQPRSDVGIAYPGYGSNHGFEFQIQADTFIGTQLVCVYAINSVAGINPSIGCKQVVFESKSATERGRDPIGNLDSVALSDSVLTISGWSVDPDTHSPIFVHAYVGSNLVGYGVSDGSRSDVEFAFPGYGANHGFKFDVPATSFRGNQQVCVFAINSMPGHNPQLGCKQVDFGGIREQGRAPIGDLESVTAAQGQLRVSGWAIDPDTELSINVHVYLGSKLVAVQSAAEPRQDVATLHPEYGPEHGFDFGITTGGRTGIEQLCVYGINSIAGRNPLLGCKAVNFDTIA